MKKITLFILITLFSLSIKGFSQRFFISGGMGLNYLTMENLNDYLTYNWGFKNRRDDSHGAIEFSTHFGSVIKKKFLIELGLNYSTNSFQNESSGFYQFEYTIYYPEIIFSYVYNYLLSGIQFGVGYTYYFIDVNETRPTTTLQLKSNSKGQGISIKSVFFAPVGEKFFVELTGQLRWVFFEDIESEYFVIREKERKLNLSYNSIGLKLGIRYYL